MPATLISADGITPIIEDKFGAANAAEYGRICSFLTNEPAVLEAMRVFDGVMQECAVHWGPASQRIRDRNPSFQVKDAISAELGVPLLGDASFARTVHFGKTIREIEDQWGFSNTGKIFTGNVPAVTFLQMIEHMETWRDSIAFDHGEYTHRLQWMAIIFHFNYGRSRLRELYRGTGKKALRDGIMLDSASRGREVYLWDFLVDCFSSVSVPSYNANTMIATHIVSDSFRSPNNFTKYFRTCAHTPFLRDYLNSSRAKLDIAGNQMESLKTFRIRRIHEKSGQTVDKKTDAIFDPKGKTITNIGGEQRTFADPPV